MGTRGYRRFEWLPGSLVARGILGTLGTKASTGRARGHAAEEALAQNEQPAERHPKPDRPPARPNKRVAVAQRQRLPRRWPSDLRRAMPRAADALADERPAAAAEARRTSPRHCQNPRPRSPHGHACSTGLTAGHGGSSRSSYRGRRPLPPYRWPPQSRDGGQGPRGQARCRPDGQWPCHGRSGCRCWRRRKESQGGMRRLDMDDFDGVDNAPLGWAGPARRPPARGPASATAETWTVARVFPTPNYAPGYSGPRNDFRETVFWQPTVQTGQDGKATVSFMLSDAVTSFRVLTEGVGGGAGGRDETVLKSSLPFSVAVEAAAGSQ